MPSDLVDIGVNLGHRRFSADRPDVLARAAAAGVTTLILTGTSPASSQNAADLAAEAASASPALYATAGVHPHHAGELDAAALSALRRLAALPQVVAIGETGLDFNRDFWPRDVQERAFSEQLTLACELGLPLFLHEREASARLIAILDSFGTALPPVVVHCFTGEAEALDAYLARGWHIGITGWICDERRGLHLRELVKRIPADRLMLETDAPFLTPRDLRPQPRGGRNEPALLPHILQTVAACRNESPESLAATTTATARAFFRL